MFKPPRQDDTAFHRADVLYALEWAAVAPGHWSVQLDSAHVTRLISVVPPGATQPASLISCGDGQTMLTACSAIEGSPRMRHCASLRDAVLAIGPLNDAQAVAVNEAMELLCPRSPDRA